MKTTEQTVAKRIYEQALKQNRDLQRQIKKERKRAYREGYEQGRLDEQAAYAPLTSSK